MKLNFRLCEKQDSQVHVREAGMARGSGASALPFSDVPFTFYPCG